MPEMNQHTIMRNTQWANMWSELTAQGWKTVQLWKTGAPNFHPEYEQVQPRMLLAPSVNAESGLVLISAGGGFHYKTYTEAHAVTEFYLPQLPCLLSQAPQGKAVHRCFSLQVPEKHHI